MKFKGKIGIWFYLIVFAANVGCIWLLASKNNLLGIIGAAAGIAVFDIFFIPILFRNYVELSGQKLEITFGLATTEVFYKDITMITKSHNPMVSYAASLDRLYIKYNKGSIMVSVQNPDLLIRELLLYNKKIEYINKKNL